MCLPTHLAFCEGANGLRLVSMCRGKYVCDEWRWPLDVACVQVCAYRLIVFKFGCGGLLIRAFELTGLCCGQPGAPNSLVQRLCLQVQASSVERSADGDDL